jgi:hypothetical protein
MRVEMCSTQRRRDGWRPQVSLAWRLQAPVTCYTTVICRLLVVSSFAVLESSFFVYETDSAVVFAETSDFTRRGFPRAVLSFACTLVLCRIVVAAGSVVTGEIRRVAGGSAFGAGSGSIFDAICEPLRSLGRGTKRRKTSEDYDEWIDSATKGNARVEQEERHGGRFACLFWKHNPIRHWRCLFLKDTLDIVTHLLRHHKQPLHCAICKEVFETPEAREQHALDIYNQADGNHQRSDIVFYGASEQNFHDIRATSRLRGEIRWFRIWTILFPTTPRPTSAYFDNEWDEIMGIARRSYWRFGPGPMRPARPLVDPYPTWAQLEHLDRYFPDLSCLTSDDHRPLPTDPIGLVNNAPPILPLSAPSVQPGPMIAVTAPMPSFNQTPGNMMASIPNFGEILTTGLLQEAGRSHASDSFRMTGSQGSTYSDDQIFSQPADRTTVQSSRAQDDAGNIGQDTEKGDHNV